MRDRGIDISGRHSKLGRFADRRFDFVISLCDRVREVCPEFDGPPELVIEHPRPCAGAGSDAEDSAAFERAAANSRPNQLPHRHDQRKQARR